MDPMFPGGPTAIHSRSTWFCTSADSQSSSGHDSWCNQHHFPVFVQNNRHLYQRATACSRTRRRCQSNDASNSPHRWCHQRTWVKNGYRRKRDWRHFKRMRFPPFGDEETGVGLRRQHCRCRATRSHSIVTRSRMVLRWQTHWPTRTWSTDPPIVDGNWPYPFFLHSIEWAIKLFT